MTQECQKSNLNMTGNYKKNIALYQGLKAKKKYQHNLQQGEVGGIERRKRELC